jgi:transcriptional regulator with XRE-family HTH domain
MKLGEKIAQLRKDKNMTQSELAEKMCITDKAVSKWERDISHPDVRTIQKLAQIFDVSIEELMGEVAETAENENKTKNLIMLVLRCVAFALPVAVLVMSIIGKLEIAEAVKLLALSVTALGLHCILKE